MLSMMMAIVGVVAWFWLGQTLRLEIKRYYVRTCPKCADKVLGLAPNDRYDWHRMGLYHGFYELACPLSVVFPPGILLLRLVLAFETHGEDGMIREARLAKELRDQQKETERIMREL